MLKSINRLQANLSANLKNIVFEGAILTIFLSFLLIVLTANIIRVFSNGRSNYATYVLEKDEQDKLQTKNDNLKQEYAYVNSNEYKLLFLRDSQNLANGNEELFQTRAQPIYYQQQPDYLNLKDKNQFTDWWISLIR